MVPDPDKMLIRFRNGDADVPHIAPNPGLPNPGLSRFSGCVDVAEPRSLLADLFSLPSAAMTQEMHMRLSVPVTDGGSLIAVAALAEDAGWFLIAIDSRLEDLDRASFRSAQEIEAVARAHLRRNHPPTGLS
jgi:hypothetical protein